MSKPPELTLYAYDTRPDIKILKQILEDKDSHIFYTERNLKTIRLKYQAMTEVPSIIEKTMSPKQLYESGSPLWTHGLSIKAIYLFAYLVPIMASKNVPLTDYMNDYTRDCQNGMNPSNARNIQLEKHGI